MVENIKSLKPTREDVNLQFIYCQTENLLHISALQFFLKTWKAKLAHKVDLL